MFVSPETTSLSLPNFFEKTSIDKALAKTTLADISDIYFAKEELLDESWQRDWNSNFSKISEA